jgi:hypothetical protein
MLSAEAKKLALKSLLKKTKQLLADWKAKRETLKVALIQEKLAAVEATIVVTAAKSSLRLSSVPGLTGIRSHLSKKTKLSTAFSVASGSATLTLDTISPQRKGDRPKKRVQTTQVSAFSPNQAPREQSHLDSSSSRLWISSTYKGSGGGTLIVTRRQTMGCLILLSLLLPPPQPKCMATTARLLERPFITTFLSLVVFLIRWGHPPRLTKASLLLLEAF